MIRTYLADLCFSNRPGRSFLKRLPGLILIFFSLAMILYPLAGEYLDERYQSKVQASYNAKVEAALGQDGDFADDSVSSYITEDGLMGFLEIPAISLNLGIYEGCGDEQLQKGVGHMKESDLPTGGKGNFCILCGHSGMRSKRMFTDLSELQKGDNLFLHVGNQVLLYEVCRTETLLPEEAQIRLEKAMKSDKGDYVVLVTCTPYGVNTHRLLVYGKRVQDSPAGAEVTVSESHMEKRHSVWMDNYKKGLEKGALAFAGVFVLYILMKTIFRRRRHKAKRC